MAQPPERSASYTTQIANLKHSKTKQTKQNSAQQESIPIVVGLEGRLEKVRKYCKIDSSNKAVSRKRPKKFRIKISISNYFSYTVLIHADIQDVVQSLHSHPKKKLECKERKQ